MKSPNISETAKVQPATLTAFEWLHDHATEVLVMIVVGGLLLRLLLAWGAPKPYGYVYDYYYKAVQVMWSQHRLPVAIDCGECYQPPLLFLSGLPLFASGRALQGLLPAVSDVDIRAMMLVPFVCGLACVWYGYRILKFFRLRPGWNALGFSLLMVLPLLFFSTWGFESDVLLGAIMTALLYYALRYGFGGASTNRWAAIRLGALAGLAAATKYSGLIGVIFMMLVIGEHTLRHFRSVAAWRNFGLAVTICAAIGSWKYVDNLERYGTPMYSLVGKCVNCTQDYASALNGLMQVKSPNPIKPYDFSTFHPRALIGVVNDDPSSVFSGRLTDWGSYRSFWTTMYGLTWNDLGMFSIPKRHGDPTSPYPAKHIPTFLMAAVFALGLVPTLLSMVGLFAVGYRRVVRPMVTLAFVSAIVYVPWAVNQPEWGTKPKYLLFLVAPFCVFAVYGFKVIAARVSGSAGTLLLMLWTGMIATTALYLAWFSVA